MPFIIAGLVLALFALAPRSAWATPTQTGLGDVADAAEMRTLAGRSIAHLRFAFDATWSDTRPPPLKTLKVGDAFSLTLVRAALDEALDTGRFANGSVGAAANADGTVDVTLHLSPRRLIERVEVGLVLVGGARFEREDLLREAGLTEGGEIVARELPMHEHRLFDYLVRRGFPDAKAHVTTRVTDDPLRVIVAIDVDLGTPRDVTRRAFYVVGVHAAVIETTTDAYLVKAGDRADEQALTAADIALATNLKKRGYFDADVTHDMVPYGAGFALRVRVDPGPFVEIAFVGNDAFDEAALTGALELAEDPDRTAPHLGEKVRQFYVGRGFLDVEVASQIQPIGPGPDRSEAEGQTKTSGAARSRLLFRVHESGRVRVNKREYPCFREDVARKAEDAPKSASEVGSEIDSFLEEELPGADIFVSPPNRAVDGLMGGGSGTRAEPLLLEPRDVMSGPTYQRAAEHLQDLFRADGFLSARVGPLFMRRRACDPRSPPGRCVPIASPPLGDMCTYDAQNLPATIPPQDPSTVCFPDAARKITCERELDVLLPIKLGPRTFLYDIAFTGTKGIDPAKLVSSVEVPLGKPVSTKRLDDLRRQLVELYREEGYAFVDLRYTIETSPDRTRARVRFDVTESDQVRVANIVVRGNMRTTLNSIMKRVALKKGGLYRASQMRLTEEQVATLGVFASVSVNLEEPFVPGPEKTVIINVVERTPQYIEPSVGISSNEGIRGALEYGHLNLNGSATSLSLRLQMSYLPNAFIIDNEVFKNYGGLSIADRLAFRATGSVGIPEIGFGPRVRAAFDSVGTRDLQRDYTLTKLAAVPNITFRASRALQISLFQSFEYNNVLIFDGTTVDDYLRRLNAEAQLNSDLAQRLRVPDGPSVVFAQRLVISWDRRDNTFNASRGTYAAFSIEHVDAFPTSERATIAGAGSGKGHFFRIAPTFAGYIPLPRNIRIAAQLRVGYNLQLTNTSQTYPDRQFFMGGVDSMRGWLTSTFIPQDQVDQIEHDASDPAKQPKDKLTADKLAVRGGDFMVNPRIELRVPIRALAGGKPRGSIVDLLETAIFLDTGNLWTKPSYPFERNENGDVHGFPVRASVGTGARLQTPVGPVVVDWGYNLTRKSYEDEWNFHFAVGLF